MVESVVVVIVQLSLEKTERGLNRRMVWVGFRDAHRQRRISELKHREVGQSIGFGSMEVRSEACD